MWLWFWASVEEPLSLTPTNNFKIRALRPTKQILDRGGLLPIWGLPSTCRVPKGLGYLLGFLICQWRWLWFPAPGITSLSVDIYTVLRAVSAPGHKQNAMWHVPFFFDTFLSVFRMPHCKFSLDLISVSTVPTSAPVLLLHLQWLSHLVQTFQHWLLPMQWLSKA